MLTLSFVGGGGVNLCHIRNGLKLKDQSEIRSCSKRHACSISSRQQPSCSCCPSIDLRIPLGTRGLAVSTSCRPYLSAKAIPSNGNLSRSTPTTSTQAALKGRLLRLRTRNYLRTTLLLLGGSTRSFYNELTWGGLDWPSCSLSAAWLCMEEIWGNHDHINRIVGGSSILTSLPNTKQLGSRMSEAGKRTSVTSYRDLNIPPTPKQSYGVLSNYRIFHQSSSGRQKILVHWSTIIRIRRAMICSRE